VFTNAFWPFRFAQLISYLYLLIFLPAFSNFTI